MDTDGTLIVRHDALGPIEKCDRVEIGFFSYFFDDDDFYYFDDFFPPFKEYELSATGWCSSNLDKLVGSFPSVDDCWYECNKYYHGIVAVDWYEDDGRCYCE